MPYDGVDDGGVSARDLAAAGLLETFALPVGSRIAFALAAGCVLLALSLALGLLQRRYFGDVGIAALLAEAGARVLFGLSVLQGKRASAGQALIIAGPLAQAIGNALVRARGRRTRK